MKKVLSIVMAVVLGCVSITGCSAKANESETSSSTGAAAETADKEAVAGAAFGGVSNPGDQTYLWCSYESTDDFMLMVYEGFEDCGKMLGVNTAHVGSSQNDLTEYINTVERAISMEPDGIAVHVFNADAYIDVINKAVDGGIPVITTGPDSPNSKRICNVGVENIEAGAFGAERLGEAMNGTGKVLILTRAGQNNSELRVQGFKETLAEKYPSMEVVSEISVTAEIADQASKTAAALTANPEISAIFCSLGIQAVGASQGCDQVGRSDITVFGFDRNPAQLELVKEGKVMGSIAQGCYNMGWWACMGLYIEHNNLLGDRNFPTFISAGVSYIDQSNVDKEIEESNARIAAAK
ncbi:substrate-binding domain-containing protein [Lacrimispora sp. 210928-DFI.3.58]|uniref:substrate-binding domain-containing protein n=1 Tax=Lacrimispora sp. 210928-DFI.3.58 TaxID=2883214 RepID=UPI0015B61D1B|nr:substrate-binding domain-containing protein [Lacrimispora sp. 210928-DFI.3.58]MCB7318556.1 substrate-binding domain-containing protein [Lacrimispora sp. 210928-DFI.3.58]